MRSVPVILVGFLGLALSCGLIPLIQRFSRSTSRRQFHQTHETPISRFGGLAIACASLIVGLIAIAIAPAEMGRAALSERCIILGSSLAMFLLGFADDWRALGAKRKLLGQILIASVVYVLGTSTDSHLSITTFRNPFTLVDYSLGLWSYL